jgi:hypothetical protein
MQVMAIFSAGKMHLLYCANNDQGLESYGFIQRRCSVAAFPNLFSRRTLWRALALVCSQEILPNQTILLQNEPKNILSGPVDLDYVNSP